MALLVGSAAIITVAVATWLAWPQLCFWYLFAPLENNAQGFPEYRHRQTGIIFVRVQGGTFWMGSPESEAGHQANEGPVHEVTLSPFLIAKFGAPGQAWERGRPCRVT